MGGRWLVQIISLTVAALFVACGDNNFRRDAGGDEDAPADAPVDAPNDATDAPVDMGPDSMVDAACLVGTTPMQCPSGCTDVNVDPNNCGACGTTCTGGTPMCTNGLCCGTTEDNCSGQCKNLQTDDNNCGVCGTVCGNNESCVAGVCRTDCTGGLTNCGPAPGVCVDTQTNNSNCGACGTAPPSAPTQCVSGEQCVAGDCVCDTPDTCGTTCTNTGNDPLNCGTCGITCGVGESCNNGQCVPSNGCQSPTQNCNGSCSDVTIDPFNCGACGTRCAAGQVCNNGTCAAACTSGTDCFGACVNTQTEEQHCGTCGNECAIGATCSSGNCNCPGGTTACSGFCVDMTSDEANCGACGNTCTGTQMCVNSVCQTQCSGATPNLCGAAPGICTNFQVDNNNCGACGNVCGANTLCTNGQCITQCPNGSTLPTEDDRCGVVPGIPGQPGFCTDFNTNDATCGNCTTQCAANRDCIGGSCQCVGATPTDCSGTCTNLQSDPNHCGDCTTVCSGGTPLCLNGVCSPNCTGNTTNCGGSCVDLMTDPLHCGSCPNACPGGATCVAGGCVCPAGSPTTCTSPTQGAQCVDLTDDPDNCGACNTVCGINQTCSNGKCCGNGTTGCNGQCVDTDTDSQNCGACGNACTGGRTCNNGVCECGYGYTLCGGQCIPTATDPQNCGGCNITCPAAQACSSNGCVSTCPPPLVKCGQQCINPNTDSLHCGSCSGANAVCGPTQGCNDGQCVTKVVVGPDPAKCVGGGPPIFVPIGGGDVCTGNLGSTNFTFAMCSRTDISGFTQNVTTDGFNSAIGPYVPGGLGGGIGVNGTYEANKTTVIGGNLFVGGTSGWQPTGDTTVRQRVFILHSWANNQLLTVQENEPLVEADSYIGGPITGNSASDVQDLVTGSCAGLPAALARDSCTANLAAVQAFFQNPPCGTAMDLIPIASIVDHFSTTATNDNDLINLDPNALVNGGRLDLPCGYYYLNSIAGSNPATIVVHGRTALFVGAAIDLSKELYFDLTPGSTLDVFVKGYMTSSMSMQLGNPNYPRLLRVYVGGVNTTGESLKLSGGETYLNGVFYAGYGQIRNSNELEMYGALFANSYRSQGTVFVHYDEGITQIGEECPDLQGGQCDTCRDCDNQACVGGICGNCTSDAQCCSPLRCVNPGPSGTCEI